MKKIIILLFCFFLFNTIHGFAQTQVDSIIYLKNGYTVKGKIIERKSGNIKVQTKDNTIFEYNLAGIDKITGANTSESENKSGNFSIGINAGLNLSSFKMPDDDALVKRRLGISTGVSIAYKISKLLSLQSGLYFEQKGCTYQFTRNIYDYVYLQYDNIICQQKINLSYITIPAKINFQFGKKIIFFANIGANASYLIRGIVAADEKDINDYFFYNYNCGFSKLDFGLNLGCGVEIPLSSKMNLIAQANHNNGLAHLDGYMKNKSFGILLGAVYYLNEKF